MAFDLTPSKNAKGRYSHQSGTPSSASGHRQDSSPSDGQEADRLSKHHHPRRHGGYSTQNAHSRAMVPDNRRAAERDDPKETDTYTSGVITCKDFVPTTKKFTRTEKNPSTRPSTSRSGTNKKPIRATEEVACPKKVPANGLSFSCTGTNIKLIRATEEVACLRKVHANGLSFSRTGTNTKLLATEEVAYPKEFPANRSDTSRTGTSKELVHVQAPSSRSDIEYYVQRRIEHNKSPECDRRPVWTRPRLQAAKKSKSGKGLSAERDLVDSRRTPSSKVKQTPVSDSQVQQETYDNRVPIKDRIREANDDVSSDSSNDEEGEEKGEDKEEEKEPPSVEPARTHRGPTSSIEMRTLRAPYPMGMGPSHGK